MDLKKWLRHNFNFVTAYKYWSFFLLLTFSFNWIEIELMVRFARNLWCWKALDVFFQNIKKKICYNPLLNRERLFSERSWWISGPKFHWFCGYKIYPISLSAKIGPENWTIKTENWTVVGAISHGVIFYLSLFLFLFLKFKFINFFFYNCVLLLIKECFYFSISLFFFLFKLFIFFVFGL